MVDGGRHQRHNELVLRALGGEAHATNQLDVALDEARARHDFEAVGAILDPIARAASTGDRHALALLVGYVDNHRLAHATIRKVVLDPDQVEEAAQDTLVAVVRGISSFEGRSRFTSWLYTVALNAAKQLVRRSARQAIPSDAEPVTEMVGLRRVSSFVADRAAVERAVAALPADLHRVLVLREYEQRSYQEIAAELGIEMGTVKSRLSRAREQVAASLAGAA